MSRIDPRQCPHCGGVGEHGYAPGGSVCPEAAGSSWPSPGGVGRPRGSQPPYARRAAGKAHLEVQLSQDAVEALNGHAKRLGVSRLALLSEIAETVLTDGLVTAVLDK